MPPATDLPSGWVLEAEQTRYDSMMGRDYTTIRYRHPETDQTIRVFEVLEPRTSTWGFSVSSSGPSGDLGTAEDVAGAKELAIAHMTDTPPA